MILELVNFILLCYSKNFLVQNQSLSLDIL